MCEEILENLLVYVTYTENTSAGLPFYNIVWSYWWYILYHLCWIGYFYFLAFCYVPLSANICSLPDILWVSLVSLCSNMHTSCLVFYCQRQQLHGICYFSLLQFETHDFLGQLLYFLFIVVIFGGFLYSQFLCLINMFLFKLTLNNDTF